MIPNIWKIKSHVPKHQPASFDVAKSCFHATSCLVFHKQSQNLQLFEKSPMKTHTLWIPLVLKQGRKIPHINGLVEGKILAETIDFPMEYGGVL